MATQGGQIEQKTIGLEIGTSGTFTNVELVDGVIKLKKISPNSTTLHSEGEWISDTFDIGDNFQSFGKVFTTSTNNTGSTIAVLTKTSDDGINFDEWIAVAEDGAIQSVKRRFISVKVVFYSGGGVARVYITTFPSESNKSDYAGGEDVKFDYYGGVTLNTSQITPMDNIPTWGESGTLYKGKVEKEKWEKITKFDISNGERTIFFHNGEYKIFTTGDNKWTSLSTTLPTKDVFNSKGMTSAQVSSIINSSSQKKLPSFKIKDESQEILRSETAKLFTFPIDFYKYQTINAIEIGVE